MLVVHLDFVQVGDDVQMLRFKHLKGLLPKCSHGHFDVAVKKLEETVVVDLPLGTVDEPELVAVLGPY